MRTRTASKRRVIRALKARDLARAQLLEQLPDVIKRAASRGEANETYAKLSPILARHAIEAADVRLQVDSAVTSVMRAPVRPGREP